MSTPTIRDVTYQRLRELGLTTIFGNPGSTEETFLKDFPADFRYVLTLHEAAAVGVNTGVRSAATRIAPDPASSNSTGDRPLSALSLFQTLRAAAPTDTVLVEESPSTLGDLHTVWPVDQPDSFYPFAGGSLGWNLPASVGLALAERDSGRHRPVLAVIGDGSFQYSIQGLWTTVQQALPILFVVPRNGQYGILKSFALLEETPGVPGLDIPGLDFVADLNRGSDPVRQHAVAHEDLPERASARFFEEIPGHACSRHCPWSAPTTAPAPLICRRHAAPQTAPLEPR